jgi:hypothetical protein
VLAFAVGLLAVLFFDPFPRLPIHVSNLGEPRLEGWLCSIGGKGASLFLRISSAILLIEIAFDNARMCGMVWFCEIPKCVLPLASEQDKIWKL